MKVTCTIPFVTEVINELPFVAQDDGSVVATGMDVAVAAQFGSIPGYTVEAESTKEAKAAAAASSDTTTATDTSAA